jgi:pimeloyl-ACP methyl ester carboxylesterase
MLDVAGAALAYRTVGEGPPLVLVHGSATDLTTWDDVVDELSRNFRVIAYDRRGYGIVPPRRLRPPRPRARPRRGAGTGGRVAGSRRRVELGRQHRPRHRSAST